jgi:hypothetical protein
LGGKNCPEEFAALVTDRQKLPRGNLVKALCSRREGNNLLKNGINFLSL